MTGHVQLIHGDFLEVLPTLPHGSVAMVFMDLPYRSSMRKTTDLRWDVPIDINKLWPQIWRVLNAGVCVASATQPFASTLVVSQMSTFRYDIIWVKCRGGGWFNANRAPLRAHEHILVFSEQAVPYMPQMEVGAPYTRPGATLYAAKAFSKRQMSTKRKDVINKGMRYPTSVQKFPRDKGKFHPTQKPAALLEWLIKTYTKSGDTVLDPCAGSFTTAVAALRTGRNCICIEKDADYFAIGKARVEEEQALLAEGAA